MVCINNLNVKFKIIETWLGRKSRWSKVHNSFHIPYRIPYFVERQEPTQIFDYLLMKLSTKNYAYMWSYIA